jgi:hypothetical protein
MVWPDREAVGNSTGFWGTVMPHKLDSSGGLDKEQLQKKVDPSRGSVILHPECT